MMRARAFLLFLLLLLPGLAKAQVIDDGRVTGDTGPVDKVTCPGGECGTRALGSGSEDVTAIGPSNTDKAPDPPCTGDACGQLPADGDLG
ncbi:MAG TPA: hypothetical protein VIJ61_19670, partial [Thermoanaerobaculia bacterium]